MSEPTPTKPEIGSKWRYKNGNVYEVIHIANEETYQPSKHPVTVVYKGINGKIWVRPLRTWHLAMTEVQR